MSVATMQVLRFFYNYTGNYFVVIMQLKVSEALMQVPISAANMWVTIFIVIMQVGVSVAIMQVAFCKEHYSHDCFYFTYASDCFCYNCVGESFK